MYVVDGVIKRIDLRICEKASVLAGELIALFGIPPTHIFANFDRPLELLFGNDEDFYYSEFSPYDTVGSVSISYLNTVPQKWHGLIAEWRYCQLELRPTMQCP
jgi:hypothetical protein